MESSNISSTNSVTNSAVPSSVNGSRTELFLSSRTGEYDLRSSGADISIEEQEILAHIQELQIELAQLKEQAVENVSPTPEPTDPGGRLIVVSNSLPIALEKITRTHRWRLHKTTGGLDKLMCLSGLRQDMPFLWVGYVGKRVPKQDEDAIRNLLLKMNCVPVFLDSHVASEAKAFSSDVLWSLFHYVPEPTRVASSNARKFEQQHWEAYQIVNSEFAKVIGGIYQEGDRVWIHDHHLMLLPAHLRERVPKCSISWFLHTPFPSSDVYRRLPVRQELLKGLLSADLLGFQTYDYARHFLSACQLILGADCSPKGVRVDAHHFMSIGVYPIGIDTNHFATTALAPATQTRIQKLSKIFEGKKILLGIDRLDYIKGIPHKLLAMEVLLTRYPEWQGKVVLIQVGIASRTGDTVEESAKVEESSTYRSLLVHINQIAGRINGAFGTLDYHPIHFINQPTVDAIELCALYKLADVCVVTSTRDGMNLVSHEFVVCQNNQEAAAATQTDGDFDDGCGPGALVLSEFAGCAQSLSGAILVNPWNTEDVAAAMHQALTMSRIEREIRQQKLFRYVSTNTVGKWASDFSEDLIEARQRNLNVTGSEPPRLLPRDALAAYRQAQNRVIIIDYDGTLTPIPTIPGVTPPSSFLKSVLESLSEDPNNTVFIVSSRERRFLEAWLTNVNVGMAAEDGLFYRMTSQEPWKTMSKYPEQQQENFSSWKDMVIPVMQSFTERTPGSYIESKESSLTWHYRDSDVHFGSWQAKDLHTTLERHLCGTALEVVQGNRLVEVKHEGCTKATILEGLLKYMSLTDQISKRGSEVDFVFCVGDDASDEQMFQSLHRIHTEVLEAPSEGGNADSDHDETLFSSLEYETVRMKADSSIFTVHVGPASHSSHAAFCLHTLGQLRRILRGFAEISRSYN